MRNIAYTPKLEDFKRERLRNLPPKAQPKETDHPTIINAYDLIGETIIQSISVLRNVNQIKDIAKEQTDMPFLEESSAFARIYSEEEIMRLLLTTGKEYKSLFEQLMQVPNLFERELSTAELWAMDDTLWFLKRGICTYF